MLPNDQGLLSRLNDLASIAIARTLDSGGRQTKRPTGEVSAVKTMTLDGSEEIAKQWSVLVIESISNLFLCILSRGWFRPLADASWLICLW